MKFLLNLVTNILLKRKLHLFKEGDFLYIQEYGDNRVMDGALVKIVEVRWKGWFTPTLLQAVYASNNTPCILFMKNLYRYSIYPGKIAPKFSVGQPVVRDGGVFIIEEIFPYVWHSGKTGYFTYRYYCSEAKSKRLGQQRHSYLESELTKMVNTSRVWQSINLFQDLAN